MSGTDGLPKMTDYRVILLTPGASRILVTNRGDNRLLHILVPPGIRVAAFLQQAIKDIWGLQAVILDPIPACSDGTRCVTAELLDGMNSELQFVSDDDLSDAELSQEQRDHLRLTLSGEPANAPFQVGWIDKAIEWLECVTRTPISSKSAIEQYNAGGSFTLLRFETRDGRHYWLKATGQPNIHEFAITRTLSTLCADCLPKWIAGRQEWNAWITLEQHGTLNSLPAESSEAQSFLQKAAISMATLQSRTIGQCARLRLAGALDQGMKTLLEHSQELFAFLEQVTPLQVSTRVPKLEKGRIRQLHGIVDDTCRRMEDLHLPETVIHGDLNGGNLLVGKDSCQFIDWSETFVGHPLVMLQHLLELNKAEAGPKREDVNAEARQAFRNRWAEVSDARQFDRGFVYAPLLAVVTALYGRGTWLSSDQRNDPVWQAYARSLARCMHRHALNLPGQEGLCH